MSRRELALFEGARLTFDESQQLAIDSIATYGPRYRHWAVAWSGGKDSTATLTFLVHLVLSGRVPPPARLTVLYVDTRLELLPLWLSAAQVRARLEELRPALAALGVALDVRTILPPLEKRYLVYVLGRGVPPSNNRTLRWCTRQTKLDPMEAALAELTADAPEPVLMITGVRQGESAVRDQRIVMSCGRDGAECGQGWFQTQLAGRACDTLAPILPWRVCHVWDWLRIFAPSPDYGAWDTALLAEAYGGEEADEKNARTGCVGCSLAEKDTALDGVLAMPQWSYLRPLKELRPLWRELRKPRHRLRKPGGERRQDGSLVANQHRMGPILLASREWALGRVLSIQAQINAAADATGRPRIDLLDAEEVASIRGQIAARMWPNGWDGDEPVATVPFHEAGDLWAQEFLDDDDDSPAPDAAVTSGALPTAVGDVLHVPDGPRQVVRESCGAAPDGFYCLTHAIYLANAGQLEFHCETGRAHVIAKHCALHGAEVWPPTETDPSLRPLDEQVAEVARA